MSSAHLSRDNETVIACPRCRGKLESGRSRFRCTGCDRHYFLPGGIPDFAPDIIDTRGLGQRFMESPTIVSMYEARFRPLFTRLGSTLKYDEEQSYLDHWLLPVEGPLLDIACGTGRYTRWLGHRHGADRVVALDLSSPMLRFARKRADEEHLAETLFVRGSAVSLPVHDSCLGAINFFGALHLIPDPARALFEVGRCLRQGGTLTCLTAGPSEDGSWRQRGETVFSALASFRFFTEDELTRWLVRVDLELLDLTRRQSALLLTARKL